MIRKLTKLLAPLRYVAFADWPRFMWFKRGMGAGETAFRIKGVSAPMRCRAGTTDAVTIESVFGHAFHLPPKHLGDSPVILDLGANAGYAAAHFASLYPNARVLAVELDSENADLARRNVAPFSNVEVVEAGVWTENGTMSYGGDNADAYAIGSRGARQARTVTIETLLDEHQIASVDFVKMDVEGAEWPLFQHPDWLKRVSSIGVEIHQRKWLAPISHILTEHGFSVRMSTEHWSQITATR